MPKRKPRIVIGRGPLGWQIIDRGQTHFKVLNPKGIEVASVWCYRDGKHERDEAMEFAGIILRAVDPIEGAEGAQSERGRSAQAEPRRCSRCGAPIGDPRMSVTLCDHCRNRPREDIGEAKVKKGGMNTKPSTPAPPPPKTQDTCSRPTKTQTSQIGRISAKFPGKLRKQLPDAYMEKKALYRTRSERCEECGGGGIMRAHGGSWRCPGCDGKGYTTRRERVVMPHPDVGG